ncbi:unnamed protein product [Prorocentrum cordatum]|uniref:valine--tRNA ligase n=1 Tax=Prorocentrum cordatum TaxID=2364126 RepID=A0ABN9RXT8_9DINO|nr:unnamed protein product [Polarella glacialis]
MPYVTEAVWQRLPRGSSSPASLMITPWLDLSGGALSDQNAEYCFDRMCSIVSKVRNARAEQEVAPKEKVALTIWCEDLELARALQEEKAVIAHLTKADVDHTEERATSKVAARARRTASSAAWWPTAWRSTCFPQSRRSISKRSCSA